MSKIISTCANKIDIKKSFDEIPLNEHQCLEQSLHFIRNNCFTEQVNHFIIGYIIFCNNSYIEI